MIWEEIIRNSKMKGSKTSQYFQEEAQKTVLTILSREGAFNDLVFQGGTALRFFYDNPRFSEDLDFVMRQKKTGYDLAKHGPKVKKFIKDVFPFVKDVSFDVQKSSQDIQRVVLKTVSELNEQNLRIHIELAYVPSYYNHPRVLGYPPLNPAVRVEDSSEILADKIIALGARSYLKGRDIWDVYFLNVEKHNRVSWDLVKKKTRDYKIGYTGFQKMLLKSAGRIRDEGSVVLFNEMKRFLPKSFFDQYCEGFDEMVEKVAMVVENGVK